MSVLVTGGAGFIGSFVVDRLLARGKNVVVLDNLVEQVHPGCRWPEYLDERAVRIVGDVCDADSVRIAMEAIAGDPVTEIVHLAALVGVGQSAYEIARYTEANAVGTATLLEVVADDYAETVRRIVTAGSMSCYGEGVYSLETKQGWRSFKGEIRSESDLDERKWNAVAPKRFANRGDPVPCPIAESVPFVCTSVYAESKRVQEELTRIVGEQSGISWAVARFFNVYGPRQALGNPYTGVAAIFASRIRNGKPPRIFEDGEQSRDFIFVEDVADAVCDLLESSECGAFNVGRGRRTSILEIAKALLEVYGRKDLGVEIDGRYRAGDIRHAYADVSKLEAATDWRSADTVSLLDGLRRLVEWSEGEEIRPDGVDSATRALEDRGLLR